MRQETHVRRLLLTGDIVRIHGRKAQGHLNRNNKGNGGTQRPYKMSKPASRLRAPTPEKV